MFLSLVRAGYRRLSSLPIDNYLRIRFPIFHLLNKQKNVCRKLMEKEIPCLSNDRVSKEPSNLYVLLNLINLLNVFGMILSIQMGTSK